MKANQKMMTLFFLNRKKASRDGLAPIYVRVTIDSKKEEFSLSIKSPLADWDNERKRVIGKCQTAKNANFRIEQTKSKLERLFIALGEEHGTVTPMLLINAYRRPKAKPSKKIQESENEVRFNKLKERIDDVSKEAFSYFTEEKKAQKSGTRLPVTIGWPNWTTSKGS